MPFSARSRSSDPSLSTSNVVRSAQAGEKSGTPKTFSSLTNHEG
ncbi:hypothetical protein HMPREF3039_02871 [Akkermansia sp. KLE1798]|nr:hypothetical protein HMPREF3039_02871 [Akkermansia sp. KLE1798]